MSKSPWNNTPVKTPQLGEVSPEIKAALASTLNISWNKEKQCDCDCHHDPEIMHMAPCCDQTYVQFKSNS